MKLLLIFIVIFNNYTWPQMIVNSSLLTMPVLIELPNAKISGTGFYFTDSNSTFLITAKHNIIDLASGILLDNKIRLYNYPRNPESDEPNVLELDMIKISQAKKIAYMQSADICLIELARNEYNADSTEAILKYYPYIKKQGPSSRISSYGRNHFKSIDSVRVSTQLYIFGYPTVLAKSKQFDPFRPLIRSGIIAGINKKNNTIIIDCPAYPGNSGGPVVIQEQIDLGHFVYSIIGIVVEQVPFKDLWQSVSNKRIVHEESYNSGLSVVVPIDELLILVNEYKASNN